MSKFVITSESVTEGHPDKVADQISDALLDAYLKQDPYSRVAVETVASHGIIFITGEVRSKAVVDVQRVARNTLKRIGYTSAKLGLDAANCGMIVNIVEQSPDIAQGVDSSTDKEQGAGDQGMMYGFACNETSEFLPLPISLAHRLARRLAYVRQKGIVNYLGPDGKTQVSVLYEKNVPKEVTAIVCSSQHDEDVDQETIKRDVMEHVIKPVCEDLITERTKVYINPTGKFVLGGPAADAGLTGRKIIVDTYGGVGRHGGGAFSGKDPSKVDRSAAYMARYIAKNIVAAGLADKCEVQLSYSIGVAEPTSVHVRCFGTHKIPVEDIEALVHKHFHMKPRELIAHLKLLRPVYEKTAAYGHFGRDDPDFTWEMTDKAETLSKALQQETQYADFPEPSSHM